MSLNSHVGLTSRLYCFSSLHTGNDNTYFNVVVNTPPFSIKNYNTFTAPNGSLFGGLIRLKMSDQGFE